MAAHALEADVTLIVLALAAGHAVLLPSCHPQPLRPGTLRVGSAVLAAEFVPGGGDAVCLPVSVCLSLSACLCLHARRAVPYVRLVTWLSPPGGRCAT